MQKKILSVFFIVLSLSVIGILYSFFNYTDDTIVETKEYLSPINKKQKKQNLSKTWIDNLVKNKKSKYLYPVNELFMHVDLQKYMPAKVKSYRLIIQNIDRYSLFCVMQTLQNFHFPFVFLKQKSTPVIYIASDNNKKLEKMERKLKKFGINSKIIEEKSK